MGQLTCYINQVVCGRATLEITEKFGNKNVVDTATRLWYHNNSVEITERLAPCKLNNVRRNIGRDWVYSVFIDVNP